MEQKLIKLVISGYKSISKDLPLSLNLGQVNILLGANGAGKSNIVGFFKMVDYLIDGKFQKFVALSGNRNSFLHYGPKLTPEIGCNIVFVDSANEYIYSFKLIASNGTKLLLDEETVSIIDKGANNADIHRLVGDFNESALGNCSDPKFLLFKKLLGGCKVYQFSDSSKNSPLRQQSQVNTAKYLQGDGSNIAAFLYLLKNEYPDSYRRIVDYVRMIIPSFGDFYLEPINNFVSLNWKDRSPNDFVFGVEQFSDGTIRFIALATLLLQPSDIMPAVIVVDEPELGLHPFAVDQLSEMIKDASLHAQIIIATQSKQIIDSFSADDIIVVEFDDELNQSSARRLSNELLSEWLEEYSMSDLWTKNVLGGLPL